MKISERREALRTRLVDAAERVIATEGLGALRARDLAAAVGCALGAIYTVFPDLDALIIAVNSRTLSMLDRHLKAVPRRQSRTAANADDPPPVGRLVALASAYLDFASAHRLRWRALFDHRMAEDQDVPEWHVEEQMRLFSLIEEPVRAMQPQLTEGERVLLTRSLFSAVHGIVSLGLEEKLIAVPMAHLRRQIALVVAAAARGLMKTASA